MRLALAPSAVVRAAAWPIETLEAFGAPDLQPTGSEGPSSAAYDAVIERERSALWERTVGDQAFMKALLFSSPLLADRARRLFERRAVRNKRMRHAETSLYRYLARAASCPTPAGLWAGVTTATFGSVDRITPARSRLHIAPDLAPFAEVVHMLAARDGYRTSACWRLNPTLQRQSSGRWHFVARSFGGRMEMRKIEPTPQIDALIESLAEAGTGTLADLAGFARAPLRAVEDLARGGALVGGFTFPTRFRTAWEALERVEDELVHDDRERWKRTTTTLRDIATELTARFDDLGPDDIERQLIVAGESVRTLGRHFGIEPSRRTGALRCDLALPFDVTLGAATHERLSETLRAYQQQWLDGVSPRSAMRRARRRALLTRLSGRPMPFWASHWASLETEPVPDPQTTLADHGAEEIVLRNAGPFDPQMSAPWGCLYARLGQQGPTAVIGVDDNPVRAFARHASLLGAHALEEWLRRSMTAATDDGVTIADLVVPFDRNPNVLARPALTAHAVEPWAAGGPCLRGATLRERSGALVLDVPSFGTVVTLPLYSAHVLGIDPVAASLALTGFDESGFEFPSPAVSRSGNPVDPSDEPLSTPSIRLSTGTPLRSRRMALEGDALQALTELPRRARYARWRALAGQAGFSGVVAVSFDGGRAVTLPASSPLALEAAFEGARTARHLVVEAFDTESALACDDGHHVAEIALPFGRSPHAWSS